MIKIDISSALFVYLTITVILVIGVWFLANTRTRLKTYVSEERFIWHCAICYHTYIDSKNEDISRCPKCGSYIDKADRIDATIARGKTKVKRSSSDINKKGRKELP